MKEVPIQLKNEKNEKVLSFLEGLSCHGDIVEPLNRVLKDYPMVQSFCPDGNHFSYCIWYKDEIIFAFAIGMSNVHFSLPNLDEPFDGMEHENQAGNDWYAFPFDSEHLKALVDYALGAIQKEVN